MDRHILLEIGPNKREWHDWQNEVQIYANLDTLCNKLIDTMTDFESFWDDQLGHI